jgi:hypothetical protein
MALLCNVLFFVHYYSSAALSARNFNCAHHSTPATTSAQIQRDQQTSDALLACRSQQ